MAYYRCSCGSKWDGGGNAPASGMGSWNLPLNGICSMCNWEKQRQERQMLDYQKQQAEAARQQAEYAKQQAQYAQRSYSSSSSGSSYSGGGWDLPDIDLKKAGKTLGKVAGIGIGACILGAIFF
ncbi:MAG: hypothetical protein MJ188_09980 [Treponema sp.]|nr:hypothetical protein [Treponema sp.]